MKDIDVVGIGNPLLDFIVQVEDGILAEVDLEKAGMHLIDSPSSSRILQRLASFDTTTAPGGSTANVLAGVAALGGSSLLMGKVGSDEHADLYEQGLNVAGIDSRLSRADLATGHAITFITPDKERTFATFLGASLHFTKEDVFEEDIARARYLHIEGYQLEPVEQRLSARHAMRIAKTHGTKVSIDLSDAALLQRAGAPIELLLQHADIIFANEQEAKEFTGRADEAAARTLLTFCDIAVVKLGGRGSIIATEDEVLHFPAEDVDVINTNGAGDMYAGALLWCLCRGIPLDRAGRIATRCAAKVVASPGARTDEDLASIAEET